VAIPAARAIHNTATMLQRTLGQAGVLRACQRTLTPTGLLSPPRLPIACRFNSTDKKSISPASTNNGVQTGAGRAGTAPTAGLSEETIAEWRRREGKGEALPVIWDNPGAYGQMARVSPAVLSALPPPARPLWPESEWSYTFRYIKAFGFAVLLAGLAGYLQAKHKVHGSVRWELEHSTPWLVDLLVKLGVVQDYEHLQATMDKNALFTRIFQRYSNTGGTTIPLSRAVVIIDALLGNGAPSDTGSGVKASAKVTSVLSETNLSHARTLTQPQFIALAAAATADVPAGVLYLGSEEVLGVTYVSPAVEERLKELYEKLVASRPAKNAFSAATLAELCNDIGFSADQQVAYACLADSTAVMSGLALLPPLPSPPTKDTNASTPLSQLPWTTPVPLSSSEFINFMSTACSHAQIEEERIEDYLRVYYMLHMSGIKSAAGVPELK
jgi:hypothetical protein